MFSAKRGRFLAMTWRVAGCLLSFLATGNVQAQTVATVGASASKYEYFSIGDVAAKTPGKTSPGLLLMGGGREIKAAFEWFAAQAGHGHIVILRASGDNELQNWIYREVGGVASVQTLIFHARAPASDPRVLDIVRHADGIFIAGGDQAN